MSSDSSIGSSPHDYDDCHHHRHCYDAYDELFLPVIIPSSLFPCSSFASYFQVFFYRFEYHHCCMFVLLLLLACRRAGVHEGYQMDQEDHVRRGSRTAATNSHVAYYRQASSIILSLQKPFRRADGQLP